MIRSVFSALALASLVVASMTTASAQDAAPVVAPPPLDCPKPGNPPLDRQGSDMTRFQKRIESYKNCINAYAKVNGAKAQDFANQARAYQDAVNGAIGEYNTYVSDLNAKEAK